MGDKLHTINQMPSTVLNTELNKGQSWFLHIRTHCTTDCVSEWFRMLPCFPALTTQVSSLRLRAKEQFFLLSLFDCCSKQRTLMQRNFQKLFYFKLCTYHCNQMKHYEHLSFLENIRNHQHATACKILQVSSTRMTVHIHKPFLFFIYPLILMKTGV